MWRRVLEWPGAGRDDVGVFVLDLSLWLSTTHSHGRTQSRLSGNSLPHRRA